MSEGLQSVAHEILEPTGFQPVVVQFDFNDFNLGGSPLKLTSSFKWSAIGCIALAASANYVCGEDQPVVTDPKPPGEIHYINPDIPELKRPEYPGEYYEALVPATIDLAENARLSVNALTGMMNPNCDEEIYMVVHLSSDPPVMIHSQHDLQTTGKYLEVLPLVRSMCGSKVGLDNEYGLMKAMLKMQGPDGLIYLPTSGRPWTLPEQGDPNSGLPDNKSHIEQITSLGYGCARMISAFLIYHQKDPDGPWLVAARRLIAGFEKTIITERDKAYIFSAWTTPDRPVAKLDQWPKGVLGGQAAWVAKEFVRYDRAVNDPWTTRIAENIMRYAMRDMNYFDGDGTFVNDGPPMGDRAHFYTHAQQIVASLYIAERTGNPELRDIALKAYEYAVQRGNAQTGFFPEFIAQGVPNYRGTKGYGSETCAVTAMIYSGILLSRMGIDKWDNVDRWVRNQLVENQLTCNAYFSDGRNGTVAWWKRPSSGPPWPEGRFTTDHVLDRTLGGFATHPSANDWEGWPDNSIFNCCSGSGARGLYYAWRHILTYDAGKLRVNLLMNRASKWADVDSYIPYTGRVDVKIKQPVDLAIRIPEWVEPDQASCTIDGKAHALTFDGRYAQIGGVTKDQVISLTFPIQERTETVHIQGDDYKITRRGNDIVAIDPPGMYVPMYQREHYRHNEPFYRNVTRFVSEEDFEWF